MSNPVKEIWAAAAVFQRGSGKIEIFMHAGPTEAEALGRAVAGNKGDGSPMIAKVTLLCASVNEDGGSNNG